MGPDAKMLENHYIMVLKMQMNHNAIGNLWKHITQANVPLYTILKLWN